MTILQTKNIEFYVHRYIYAYGFNAVRDLLSCSRAWLEDHRYYYIHIDSKGVIGWAEQLKRVSDGH